MGTGNEQSEEQSAGDRESGDHLRLDYYDRSNEDKSLSLIHIFWDNYPSSYNSTISPDDIKLFIGRIFQYGYTAVSYTHLDVYKRQNL